MQDHHAELIRIDYLWDLIDISYEENWPQADLVVFTHPHRGKFVALINGGYALLTTGDYRDNTKLPSSAEIIPLFMR